MDGLGVESTDIDLEMDTKVELKYNESYVTTSDLERLSSQQANNVDKDDGLYD